MAFELELEKVLRKIGKAKKVCIQLPDGLKPRAQEIVDVIEAKSKAKVLIWAGSCFGACDIPNMEADLLIQWGHDDSLRMGQDIK